MIVYPENIFITEKIVQQHVLQHASNIKKNLIRSIMCD